MALRALCVLAHLLLVVALESAPPALAPLRQDPASPPAALKVRLGAPWPRSNATRLMESAEFLAQQSGPDAFWHLVTTGSLPLLDAHSALLLDLSLAVHVHALALEQQRVLQEALRAGLEFADAERCRGGAFAAIQSASQGTYGVCADGLDVVPAACAAGGGDRRKLLVLSSDHVHPRSSAAPDAPVVILHGELGSRSLDAMLRRYLAEAGEIKLVVRLAAQSAGAESWGALGGFGATLDVKSTEYVTVDLGATDWKAQTDADVVRGLVFSALVARPDAAGEEKRKRLASLHASLRNEEARGLRFWEMRDLSMQLALDCASHHDPLRRLADVTCNLPAHTARLARLPVPAEFRDMFEQASQAWQSAGAWLLMDGRLLPGSKAGSDDLAASLQALAERFALDAAAARLPVTRAQLQQALGATPAGRAALDWGPRVDVRRLAKGAVVFVNDIEKDEAYASWPGALAGLRGEGARGGFAQVRRNLFTAVLVLDPAAREAEEALRMVEYLVVHGAPVRFGLVFTSSALAARFKAWKDEEETGLAAGKDACGAACVAQLVFAARKAHGAMAALAAAGALVRESQAGLSVPAACEVFAEAVAEATGAWRTGPLAAEAEAALAGDMAAAAKMARYAGALALPVPCFTFNGAVLPGAATRLDRRLSPLLMEEQARLRVFLESGLLEEEGEVLQQVLRSAVAQRAFSAAASAEPTAVLPLVGDVAWAKYCRLPGAEQARVTLWVPVPDGQCGVLAAVLAFAASGQAEEHAFRLAAFPVSARGSAVFWAAFGAACARGDLQEMAALARTCATAGREALSGQAPMAVSSRLPPGLAALVVNGRVMAGELTESDVGSVVRAEDAARGRRAAALASGPDDIMRVASVLGLLSRPNPAPAVDYSMFPHVSVPARDADAGPELTLLVDPLSPHTPRAAALALVLRDRLGVRVKLALAASAFVAEPPQMSYYRFAFEGAEAAFSHEAMAAHKLLTLKLSTPQAWIAYPSEMIGKDPDNLILAPGKVVELEYALAHVLVDGHVTVDHAEPAAGAQLELVANDGFLAGEHSSSTLPSARAAKGDTIVMHNLGYFQIKAAPGAWTLRSLAHSSHSIETQVVAVREFSGLAAPLELSARPSQTGAQVAPRSEDADDTVHVFSLASGALYERFLRIMMLCVRRRTSGKLKFWLLENYMSPPMKRFVPRFAAQHGFEVELVTFKWPEWLRGQSERQRQIWGMKILFLDVLFPLSVPKIIYVDADQIVRADLRELWTMDLHGAPYAMTPFCTSRKETLGFQFWRHGFWQQHLRGKNYHISALFVVDLVKFRQDAVGDQLRATYQQLSADPSSLSNLDQDLPNFAQHSIPIFSLPEEWLWCESWCSDESKARAKTLDLCNNPLHKEPKLDMARRVIQGDLFPESWDELDKQASEGFGE